MLCYGLSFATIISVLVHTGLFHEGIVDPLQERWQEEEDVHARLMSRFKTVPLWWYGAITLIMIGMSLGVIIGYVPHSISLGGLSSYRWIICCFWFVSLRYCAGYNQHPDQS